MVLFLLISFVPYRTVCRAGDDRVVVNYKYMCQSNLRFAFFLSSDLNAAYELHGRNSRRTACKNGISREVTAGCSNIRERVLS